MLSVNNFEILSKPQYTCTENKHLCVLLNGCVVSGFTPVAAVSSSGFCPHPWPRTSLRRLAMCPQPESLSLVPRSLRVLCIFSGQRAPSESSALQCFVTLSLSAS